MFCEPWWYGPPADGFDPGLALRSDGFGKMGKKRKASMPAGQKQGLLRLLKPHKGLLISGLPFIGTSPADCWRPSGRLVAD
ncbi:hypothetical protein [Arcticibacter tournemirensis]|uniref:Uncharacterized protein n=1 Tax=Arcticibacter tournemirensis TaxID=699437 RepID=A0A4V1KHN8_9SPHI|nr:hypothetical protein [Arcticibacter tournemirensis]RXF67842.1 hypothetical protein EKH83_17480 [Arcticibacter tournemirensis]